MGGRLLNAVVGRRGHMFNPHIGNPGFGPGTFLAGPVHHTGNGPATHSVHGELTAVLPAEADGGFQKFIAADRQSHIGAGTQIRPVHPGGASGDAAVSDQFKACCENLASAVQLLSGNRKVRVIGKIIPHIIDPGFLTEPF